MGKQTRSVKTNHLHHTQGRGASYEQHESYDDSLLPEATELARLRELDPNIIDWIKERTEKEQDARHDFNSRKLSIIEKGATKNFTIDLVAISCAFFIIMGGMVLSYLLIQEKQIITGTIFAGATIVFAANSFLRFRKNNTATTKKDSQSV